MKIVGEVWVTTDIVVEDRATKNTRKQRIKRESQRCLLLACGHAVPFTRFVKAPTIRTECSYCEELPILQAREIKDFHDVWLIEHLKKEKAEAIVHPVPSDKGELS